MYEKSLIGGPQGYAASASKAFRTVSLGTSVNKGRERRIHEVAQDVYFATRYLCNTHRRFARHGA
jgi:hypothetical protein